MFIKLWCIYLVQHNKDTTILYCYRSPKTVLNTPVNGKIQGLFKAFDCFSSTFQGKFNFQGLFKTVLHIQVLFKPVRTLLKRISQKLKVPTPYTFCSIKILKNVKVRFLKKSTCLFIDYR